MNSSAPLRGPVGEKLCAALETEQGSAYILGLDLSILYVNDGWRRFARKNGAPQLATGWEAAGTFTRLVAPPLRELFQLRFERVIKRLEGWSYTYECSSPDIYRKFNMRVEPTQAGNGLVVIHSLLVEQLAGPSSAAEDPRLALFTDSRGLVVQCSACGRVQRAGEPQTWDWAPGLIRDEMANVSHGICAMCAFHHYSSQNPCA